MKPTNLARVKEELKTKVKKVVLGRDAIPKNTPPSQIPIGLESKTLYAFDWDDISQALDTITQATEAEVIEKVLDTIMGIDARFNSNPADVRNKIIKAIESLSPTETTSNVAKAQENTWLGDRRCPKCGAHLLSGNGEPYCSMVGCDYGLTPSQTQGEKGGEHE